MHLTEGERSAWGEVFGDYEIIPPFPQLGRPVHRLEPGEAEAREITRFADVKVPGVSVAGGLEKAGWVRGVLHDHGDFHEHSKHFPGAGVAAVVEYEPGLWASHIADTEEQRLTRCYFLPATVVPGWRHGRAEGLPLGGIDPVVLSEVLGDLTLLASKGT